MGKFELGQTVMTRGIQEAIKFNTLTNRDIQSVLAKHHSGDWGDLEEDDKRMNDAAVENEDDRIFSMYKLRGLKVYVVTEEDRSITTVLFPEEY